MSRISKKIQYRLIEWIAPWIIRLIGYSLRVQIFNAQRADEMHRRHLPYLYCVWHGRLLLPVFRNRRRGIVAMVSQHADGEVIARIVEKFGYGTVRGSSTRGGKEAFYQLLAHLKDGGVGAMIPDGPTGPRFRLKAGSVLLAQQASCPIIPITFAAKPCWRLKSWDRMVLPKPFAKAVLCHGDPIALPAELSSDELEIRRRQIEQIMLDLVVAAESRLGVNYVVIDSEIQPVSSPPEDSSN